MAVGRADPATRNQIEQSANAAHVDPDLLEAIYMQESGANPTVLSGDGGLAYGPFQLHADRAYDNGFVGDPNALVPNPLYGDPNYPGVPAEVPALAAFTPDNIDIAARALAQNNDVCQGDPACLAAGYNLPAAIRGTHPLSPEREQASANYTNSVMRKYSGIKGGTYTGDAINGLKNRKETKQFSPDRADISKVGEPVYEGHCLDDEQEPALFANGAPLPPNPNHPTCQVQIGGQRNTQNGLILGTGFSLTPIPPQYVETFEYTQNMGAWSDQFRIRLFDPSWDVASGEEALQAIGAAQQVNDAGVRSSASYGFDGLETALLSWGYVGYPGEQLLSAAFQQRGMWSGVRQAFIIGYSPRFLGTGVEIEITGQATSIGARLRSRSVTYPTQRGATSISEIVKQIAIRNGWQYCIRPTLPLWEGKEPKKFTQAQKDDIAYIQYDLIPLARPADNPDVTGYVVYYNSQTNTLHFHPPKDGQIVRHYIYARQQLGTVLSFDPHVQPAFAAAMGGARLEVSGLDQFSKEHYNHVFDHVPDDDPSKLGPGRPLRKVFLNDTELVNRQIESDVSSKDLAYGEGLSMYRTQQFGVMTADLVVVGDPTVLAGQLVRVTAFGKDGQPHWASGVFRINQATHLIEGGRYTTSFQLQRDYTPINTALREARAPSTGADQSTQANPILAGP